MNALPGNPYAEDLEPMRGASTITDATLALAFEQRTANIIAFAQWASDSKAPASPAINFGEAVEPIDRIRARLGLGDPA